MLVEIVGGIYADSLAIITDAAHMLSDVGGFIVSLVALQLSVKGATAEYTYGFKQAEVLGALMSILIVWALTAILLWEAVPRFIHPVPIKAPVMFGIAVIGFVVNLILMKVLGHGHAHGGDDHGHAHGGDEDGVAVQAAIAHVIGDIVQSLGVCLAALLIWIKPFDLGDVCRSPGVDCVSKWNYADPMCTVLFSILVLYTTKATVVRTIGTLMGKAPTQHDHATLTKKLMAIQGVKDVHDVHVWSLGSKDVLCTAHVMVESRAHATSALNAAISVAKDMNIGHSTFQIEIVGEFDPETETFGNLCKANTAGSLGSGHGAAGHGGHGGHADHGGHSH
jgi:zinc transporter 2